MFCIQEELEATPGSAHRRETLLLPCLWHGLDSAGRCDCPHCRERETNDTEEEEKEEEKREEEEEVGGLIHSEGDLGHLDSLQLGK